MYKYINIDSDTWLVYDLKAKKIVELTTLKSVNAEILAINARISSIPEEPTALDYETWGRENMPVMDYKIERESLMTRKNYLKEVKENIK